MDEPEAVDKAMEKLTHNETSVDAKSMERLTIDKPEAEAKAMDSPVTDAPVLTPDQVMAAQLKKDYQTVTEFLVPRSGTFENLLKVQWLVRNSPKADAHFAKQMEQAASSNLQVEFPFYIMMKNIGKQLQENANIVPPLSKTVQLNVLDICMAPGGYSATVLKINRFATICGLTLPEAEGGHPVLLQSWKANRKIEIHYTDVTMLAASIGFSNLVPPTHPHAALFSNLIPFEKKVNEKAFDLVFCDGQVLRNHARAQEFKNEPYRLSAAQLAIALQRIKPGGTLVMLLHQAYGPHNIRLLEAFDQFARISLFKPTVAHKNRSSFYLVAKDVEPTHERARKLLRHLKRDWLVHTACKFELEIPEDGGGDAQDSMEKIMESFGEKLLILAEPLWRIQIEAMKEMFLA